MAGITEISSSPVSGVLFDFGGVVIDSPFAAFTALEERDGLTRNLLRDINTRNPDTNAWAQLERGSIDADGFVALFEAEAAEFGHRVDARAVLDALLEIPAERVHARAVVLDAVQRCQGAGLPVGLLTNNFAPLSTRPANAWVFETFDVVVESCRIGLRKPDPEIYRVACAELGTALESTVLLDDLGINLKAARALGMHTIKVIEPAAAIAELEALVQV